MKYLLLLLAPLLLSSSSRDHGSDHYLRLYVTNNTTCDVSIKAKVCLDSDCSNTTWVEGSVDAERTEQFTWASDEDASYLCMAEVTLAGTSQIQLDPHCGGDARQYGNCDGRKVAIHRYTDFYTDEHKIDISYYDY
jgi:hypothetical protein